MGVIYNSPEVPEGLIFEQNGVWGTFYLGLGYKYRYKIVTITNKPPLLWHGIAPPPLSTNTLYYGDCLDWMQRWDDNTVDLIYLDPPFNSSANYNILFGQDQGGGAQFRAFDDTWYWDGEAVKRYDEFAGAVARPAHKAIKGLYEIIEGSGMMAYLTYMAERLEHMHRILKPTGSLYLHCDPTASHYLKLLLDTIFGKKYFRNEIVWSYGLGGSSKNLYSKKHDTLFFYAGDGYYFDKPLIPATSLKMKGQMKGATDVWGIPSINNMAKERTGYPTQKPLALLERIIKASSKEGDIVLDPFCGCGTTIEAAERLNRQWIGIDISPVAIDIVKDKRLRNPNIPTKGIPADFASACKLAKESPFDFEGWAVTRLYGFAPNTRRVGDGGVDGRGTLAIKPDKYPSKLALSQVKGGEKFSLTHLRDFNSVAERDKGALNYFITLHPVMSRTAQAEAFTINPKQIRIQGQPFDRMNLWSIKDYFDGRIPVLPLMVDPYTGKVENQLFFDLSGNVKNIKALS